MRVLTQQYFQEGQYYKCRILKYINQIAVFFQSYFYTRLTIGNDKVRRTKCRINAERSLRNKCSIWPAWDAYRFVSRKGRSVRRVCGRLLAGSPASICHGAAERPGGPVFWMAGIVYGPYDDCAQTDEPVSATVGVCVALFAPTTSAIWRKKIPYQRMRAKRLNI